MKILVANLGSTSLKWRLFDFSNGQERLLHKGGFLSAWLDYPKAIGDCLLQLKEAGHIRTRKRPGGGRLQDHHGPRRQRLRAARRKRAEGDGSVQRHRAGAQPALYHRHPALRSTDAGGPAGRPVRDGVLPVGARRGDALRRAGSLVRAGRAALGLSRGEPQVHCRALGGIARPRRCRRAGAPALRGRRRDARCASPTCGSSRVISAAVPRSRAFGTASRWAPAWGSARSPVCRRTTASATSIRSRCRS